MGATSKRRIAAGAVVVLAVAGGGAGIAATQSSSPKDESQAVLDDAAKQLGIPSAKLSDALKKALSNRVDAAVAAGRLTPEQGRELKARIASGDYPLFSGPRGFGHDRGGRLGRGGHLGMWPGLDAAASYLGVTETQLRAQLRDGKTLADVARARGKSVDGLVDALVAPARERLDEAVAAGRLTAAERDEKVTRLRERVRAMVDGEARLHRGGPGRFGRGHLGALPGLGAAASYLGLTEAQLRAQLRDGKTLAGVARARGKSVDGLVDALVASAKKRLDDAVAAGRLTAARRDELVARLRRHVARLVEGETPLHRAFRHRGGARFELPALPVPEPRDHAEGASFWRAA